MATEKPSLEIPEKHTPGAGAARFAAALGWDHVPQLAPEEERDLDERLAAARAEADRIYGTEQEAA